MSDTLNSPLLSLLPSSSDSPDNPTAVPLDPNLLLAASGASSPSRDGTASASLAVGNVTPVQNLRDQALQILARAGQADAQTEAAPVPALNRPKISPLETAIGLALGGALNQASPFTSEGSRALNSFMQETGSADRVNYLNQLQAHSAAIDAARQGYKIASDQARGLLDQADVADQAQNAAQRQKMEQDFQENLRRENEQARIHEDELQSMHRDLAVGEAADATEKLQNQRILQQKLVDVLSQTGPGRAMLAAQAGVALKLPPDQLVQLVRIAAQSPPGTVSKTMKSHLSQATPPPAPGLPPARP